MSDLSRKVLDRINAIMQPVADLQGNPLRWFFCFGTLEEYIADMTFELNFDIDIGLFYGDTDVGAFTRVWEGMGYKLTKRVINDVTKEPFNLHFEPVMEDTKKTPTVDVYFWYEHKGIMYHTYDVKKEGRDIPSSYTFKGIPKEFIVPPQSQIDEIRKSGPEMSQMLDKNGIWHYDVFGDHSGYKFRCPFAYGTLLDEWDPGWRFRDYRRGQSKSRWIVKMKSCCEWGKK